MAVSDRCVSRQTGEKNEKPARHTKRISMYVPQLPLCSSLSSLCAWAAPVGGRFAACYIRGTLVSRASVVWLQPEPLELSLDCPSHPPCICPAVDSSARMVWIRINVLFGEIYAVSVYMVWICKKMSYLEWETCGKCLDGGDLNKCPVWSERHQWVSIWVDLNKCPIGEMYMR